MKIIQVKWRDSNRYIHQEPKQNFEVVEIQTVGYLIQEDKKKIVLCQDLIEDEYRGVIVIPKENIIKTK